MPFTFKFCKKQTALYTTHDMYSFALIWIRRLSVFHGTFKEPHENDHIRSLIVVLDNYSLKEVKG
jgi:hypothetical protein